MKVIIPLLSAVALLGCSNANAEVPDPYDDVDCALIASLFVEAAQHSAVSPREIRAAEILHHWYAAKITSEGQLKDTKLTDAYVSQVASNLSKDMEAAGQKLVTCGERADKNPAFDKFAAALGWRSAE